MFSLLRWAFVLLLCLGGIGLYRGWFSLSNPNRDAQNNKVNINVSIDAKKLEADVEKVEEEIDEVVARRPVEEKAQEVK
jgi:hypothetical protein